MTGSGIRHDQVKRCGDKTVQYTICTRANKLKHHNYGVTGCTVNKGKIYIYIIFKYANCGKNYQTTAFKYAAKQKAQSEVQKKKAKKK